MSFATAALVACLVAFTVGLIGWLARPQPLAPEEESEWDAYERDRRAESKRNLERLARKGGL